jgi:hypothetical protein
MFLREGERVHGQALILRGIGTSSFAKGAEFKYPYSSPFCQEREPSALRCLAALQHDRWERRGVDTGFRGDDDIKNPDYQRKSFEMGSSCWYNR